MIQLIIIGVMAAALVGGGWSLYSNIKAKGAAEQTAEYHRQQAEAAAENEKIAAEGKAAALRLLAAAEQRNKVQAARMRSDALARALNDDQQAAKDPAFKAWADEPVPAFAAVRLRLHVQSATGDASGSGLPSQSGVASGASTADPAGPSIDSWASRLRRKLGGSNTSGVDGSGTTGK